MCNNNKKVQIKEHTTNATISFRCYECNHNFVTNVFETTLYHTLRDLHQNSTPVTKHYKKQHDISENITMPTSWQVLSKSYEKSKVALEEE